MTSISGRIFYNLELASSNFKSFLIRHSFSIELLFLVMYVFLQMLLALSIFFIKEFTEIIVTIFIILFLFIISSERIILQFKSKQVQQEKDNLERKYFELRNENRLLRDENKKLIEDNKRIVRELAKNKKLNQ